MMGEYKAGLVAGSVIGAAVAVGMFCLLATFGGFTLT